MTQKSASDYNLELPPHTVREMEEVSVAINEWHSNGATLSRTPTDALTTSIHQTLSTARRLLNDLANPSSQRRHPERNQKFLQTFRGVLAMHAASGLDVVGLQAMGAAMELETREKAEEVTEEAAKWADLVKMLDEQEELMGTLAEKVAELEAEEERDEWWCS